MNLAAARRLAVLAPLALAASLAACKKPPAQGAFERPPAPVRVADAVGRDVPVFLDEIGRVVATETVRVQSEVTAKVMDARFTDGADLKKGDVLFVLDARAFEARLASAEATLAKSRVSAERARAAVQRPKAGLDHARAALELAKSDYARAAALIEAQAISTADYDAKKSAVVMAEAEVGEAEAELVMAEPEVREADAAIRVAEAEVAMAKLDVEYCTIRSPIDGRAGHRLVDPGNLVAANGDALVVIERMERVYVDFTVAEDRLADVQRAAAAGTPKVEVRIPGDTGPPRTGDLTFVDGMVDRTTGTLRLRATLANDDRALWPGRFVRARLVLASLTGATLVPAVAEQQSPTGPFMYVVNGEGTAEMRPVKLGQKHDGLVVVLDGVRAGERVIVDGQVLVAPGAKVSVVPDAAPAAAAK